MTITRTAESVCVGHPDKLCDLIADQILDDTLTIDTDARCAVEVMAANNQILVAGEIASTHSLKLRASIRKALRRAGYGPRGFRISVYVHGQSADIARGVTHALETRNKSDAEELLGAGDQGKVYGYATSETPERIPLPLVLAHDICHRLDQARENGAINGIYSDGKAQVSVAYDDAGVPVRVSCVVVSIQHDKTKNPAVLADEVREQIIAPACKNRVAFTEDTEVLINPSGRFVEGGPSADTGLTGRKLMVDTYGGLALHGGGAFSGKDASKVDRSGAYAARLIAKTIVDAHLAEECQVSISYAIGKAQPVAFHIDTLGTGQYADHILTSAARAVFALDPAGIIDALNLRKPQFARYATYGHMGREDTPWENTTPYVERLLGEVARRAGQTTTYQ